MAADSQVKEISLLRDYYNRLDGFKDAIVGGCVVLQSKAESILDNLQREKSENIPLLSLTIPALPFWK